MPKITANAISKMKGVGNLACLTAYDYTTARIIDECGIHLVLVGDSLGMTMLGYKNTLPVTMDEMLHHTKAVARGITNAMLVADMPFMSYQVSIEQALSNAGRFLKETNADAVKIEGGQIRSDLVRTLVDNGIPVLGHIGLTPQNINTIGSYKVQGRLNADAARILNDAKALEDAGAFAVILECLPAELGREITESVRIPTIGIGAGSNCDGQILVTHDLLGLFDDFTPRFVKRYAELGTLMRKAVKTYADDVKAVLFPGKEHSY